MMNVAFFLVYLLSFLVIATKTLKCYESKFLLEFQNEIQSRKVVQYETISDCPNACFLFIMKGLLFIFSFILKYKFCLNFFLSEW